MIEIQQLKDLDLEQVINLLLEEKTQPFDIYVPKETQLFNSEREAISMDYANLAYCGQLLFDVADEFDYDEIQPHEHKSVLFTIKAKDFERLAIGLLEISYGYVNDHPEDEEFSFEEESSNYLYDVLHGKIPEVACPYFIELSKEYAEEEESE